MKVYKCGHPIKEIIIDTNIDTLSTYNEWKDSDSELCIECWLKNDNRYMVNYESKI